VSKVGTMAILTFICYASLYLIS